MISLGGFDMPGEGPLSRLAPKETVRRIAGALNEGAEGLPPWPGVDAGWSSGNTLFRQVPVWSGEVGAVVCTPEEVWLWLGLGYFTLPDVPSQLVLALPAGRYTVTTWDVKAGRLTGTEVVDGGPVSASPPFAGGPLVVAVRRQD